MARDELQVIDRTYELLKRFLKRLEKFPRSHRYGLGQQIEQRLYALLEESRARMPVITVAGRASGESEPDSGSSAC